MSENAAFETLCRSSWNRIYRVLYLMMGDAQEARDLTQEAFTRALERWARVSKLENPEAWIQRVAINLALSWGRKRRAAARAFAIVAAAPHELAEEPAIVDETLELGLASLTRSQREAVILRFYLDWSVDETAKRLGKKPGTIRALTAQAVERLRSYLSVEEPEGIHAE